VIQNAAKYNIGVVNLSLSETQPSNYTTSLLDNVVEQVWQSGIAVVSSAGKAECDEDEDPERRPVAVDRVPCGPAPAARAGRRRVSRRR
jgi:hypothetical protein